MDDISTVYISHLPLNPLFSLTVFLPRIHSQPGVSVLSIVFMTLLNEHILIVGNDLFWYWALWWRL